MLKIRLQRTGRINDPSYRVVVLEHTESTKSGSIVERVGTYDPKSKVKNLNADRIKYWISVGAQASGTVHNMLVSAGIVKGKKINVLPQKSPPKKEGEEAVTESPKVEAPAAEAAPVEATA
jgi:small subunit ribosomal protein S16